MNSSRGVRRAALALVAALMAAGALFELLRPAAAEPSRAAAQAGPLAASAARFSRSPAANAYRWQGLALGMCWEGSPRPIDATQFEEYAQLGANAVSQTPFGWMRDPKAPTLEFRSEGGWWGESEVGVRTLASFARERGIATLLKPHLWLHDSWPGAVEMQSEADWALWFANYREFLMHWARFAAAEGLEGLCIGTELDLTAVREREWRALIAEVRAVYPGLLTYASNWTHFESVPFWDALDAIGVNAYFPLASESCPSREQLVQAWDPIAERLRALGQREGLPVVLTEIGYHSACNAFSEPWTWRMSEQPVHQEDQAAGYAAVLETFAQAEWCGGIFFWKWQAAERFGRDHGTAFTPQRKLALEILREACGALLGAQSQPAPRPAGR